MTVDDDRTRISADESTTDADGNALFSGDVRIVHSGNSSRSDTARYNDTTGVLTLEGDVRLNTGTMQLSAERGVLDNSSSVNSFENVDYLLTDRGLRGSADSIETGDSGSRTTVLENSSFTSCPPGDIDWQMDAERLEIDHDEEYGKAEDVSLEFKGVTFFYLPYMEFPIGDRRRSGLLAPEFSTSDSRGFELVVPWYWNIAPQMDAIIAPHYMNERGLQLDTQFRYLTRSTRGNLETAYLHEDDVTGETRYLAGYEQQSNLTKTLALELDINDVSDIDYFDDFSNSISTTSQTHLERTAKLTNWHRYWRSRALVQTYETVDSSIAIANRPYRRVPQLSTRGSYLSEDTGMRYSLDAQFTEFDHELQSNVRGSRLNLTPSISRTWQGAAWYLTPRVDINHISYRLEDTASPDALNVVSTSLDTGLFFERPLQNGNIQTLEPRLFYLNTPFEDQSLSPNFDSSVPTFSFAQLFRTNRFNGGDRVGDAEQLTAALSSRIISPQTGEESFRISMGQVIYLEDRRVSLGTGTETEQQSDLIAELATRWRDWRFRAGWQWDSTASNSERQNFQLRYQSDDGKLFNLGYRLQDSNIASEVVEQSDVSLVTPLSSSITLFARWNYSFVENEDIDIIGGIGYESCCYALQLIARRNRIDSTLDEFDNAILFQLVFKGLGSVTGNTLTETLTNAIPGYEEQDY